MSEIDVSIRVDGASRDVFDKVLQQLIAAGLVNVAASKRLGLANGSVDGLGLDALRRVRGVESVQQAGGLSIGAGGAAPRPTAKALPPISMPDTGQTLAVV